VNPMVALRRLFAVARGQNYPVTPSC
jgi:hypothetical protein